MNCINCQKETKNPKFCCKSCAAQYNNSISPKRKAEVKLCLNCQKQTKRKQTFCNQICRSKFRLLSLQHKIDSVGIVPNESGYVNPSQIKEYLTLKFGYKCSICSISDWQNKPLMLILDHIDGNSENWNLKNLRLICSNCDSQLPTYKSKNKGNGRHYRRIRYEQQKSF